MATSYLSSVLCTCIQPFYLWTVQLIDIAVKTGVALDPDFTAKSVRGLLSELQCNPQRFAGKRILFINTGCVQYLNMTCRFSITHLHMVVHAVSDTDRCTNVFSNLYSCLMFVCTILLTQLLVGS